jgi:hypothetical protein
MMVAWLGIALVSASWLYGLSYYQPANYWTWAALVAAGCACLSALFVRPVSRSIAAVSAAILGAGLLIGLIPFDRLPPPPALAASAGLLVGLLLWLAPASSAIIQRIGSAFVATSVVLIAQLIAITLYEAETARSHELPGALAQLIGVVSSLLSLDSGVFESTISIHSMREVHKLGATWELLVDPVSLCFFVGGCAAIALAPVSNTPPGGRALFAAKRIGLLSLIMAGWLPMRAGLLIAAYMHLGLRLDYDADPDAMILFWQSWLHGALLLPPVLAAWRFVSWPEHLQPAPVTVTSKVQQSWRPPAVICLAALSGMSAAFGLWWDPVGQRKQGRVLIDELHVGVNPRTQREMHWEPTIRAYDTEWYGSEAAYNYYCLYDYLWRYYELDRIEHPQREGARRRGSVLSQRITNLLLRDFDVLVLKVPTLDYEPEEIDAIKRFVERGGGLLLIGEHTDVFGTGRHLNSVAREFGFSFRHDCLFAIDHQPGAQPINREVFESPDEARKRGVFDQRFDPPYTPHPIVQHMPALDFATSGSIDPKSSSGRAAIRSTGLWSLPADYHADNYYPQVVWRPDMRYGAFVQLWTTRYGEGRVAAFADSTIFSNFSAFQPGKAELMLGMIEWLNHGDSIGDPRLILFTLAGVFAIGAIWLSLGWPGSWVVILAAAVGTFSASTLLVRTIHAHQMPLPTTDEDGSTRVYFDTEVSNGKLPDGSFIDGKRDGFGVFERWVLRLGYFLKRPERGESLANADLLVITYPRTPPSTEYLERLEQYVNDGGKLLVIDSADNRREDPATATTETSTANELLQPFGLSLDEDSSISGTLAGDGWPSVPVERASTITGGKPFATVAGKNVGAWTTHGEGSVFVVGFGTRFNDFNMGVTGDTIPDPEMRKVYDLQYALLRWIVEGTAYPKSN